MLDTSRRLHIRRSTGANPCPAGSVSCAPRLVLKEIYLDDMGPVGAKSYADHTLVQTRTRPAARLWQEINYGRGAKGYIFGALCPVKGEALTHLYPGRSGAYGVAFLEHVEIWMPRTAERVYAITNNLNSHRTTDVLLFLLAHPR